MNKNLKNSLNSHFFESAQSTDSVRLTPEMQREKAAYSRFSQFVYLEANKNNIKSILEIEDSILKNDLNRATDKREISSVQAGIDRVNLATKSLTNITSYRAFEKHLNSTSYKDIDSRGLPKDAFRKEIPAQITSLQNNTMGYK